VFWVDEDARQEFNRKGRASSSPSPFSSSTSNSRSNLIFNAEEMKNIIQNEFQEQKEERERKEQQREQFHERLQEQIHKQVQELLLEEDQKQEQLNDQQKNHFIFNDTICVGNGWFNNEENQSNNNCKTKEIHLEEQQEQQESNEQNHSRNIIASLDDEERLLRLWGWTPTNENDAMDNCVISEEEVDEHRKKMPQYRKTIVQVRESRLSALNSSIRIWQEKLLKKKPKLFCISYISLDF